MRLFSYCIPIDDGAAPNPYHGICTLAICKPVIRRVAQIGDWIVGVGSKNVQGVDYSNKLVYAMKVTDKMNLAEYNTFCEKFLPGKIANFKTSKFIDKIGDCIYYGSDMDNLQISLSVHNIANRSTDLGGVNTLLSDHFYYFGDKAIDIPEHLMHLVKQGQGHKSNANNHILESFIDWIDGIGIQPNSLLGDPQFKLKFSPDYEKTISSCATKRLENDLEDELIGDFE